MIVGVQSRAVCWNILLGWRLDGQTDCLSFLMAISVQFEALGRSVGPGRVEAG